MDTLTPSQRSQRMALIHGKNTGPELEVRRIVSVMGHHYKRHPSNLPGRPDLVFGTDRKIIFVHGCFWHRHDCAMGRTPKSNVAYWKAKLDTNRKRDLRVIRALRASGWKVMVIWECNLRDKEKVSRRIEKLLNNA